MTPLAQLQKHFVVITTITVSGGSSLCVFVGVCVLSCQRWPLYLSLSLQTHRTGVTYLLDRPIDACAVVDEYRAFGLLF
jgi:hypothetical protein